MTDLYHPDNSMDDVEALVRAAGKYVGTSVDLRPRVLEAARVQCLERRAQHCLGRVALFIALLAAFTATLRFDVLDIPVAMNGESIIANAEELIGPASVSRPRTGDGDWRIIDAFTKLRRQQAQRLRFEI